MEQFLENVERKSLEALERDYASGSMGLKDFLPQWDEESYQRQLEEKVPPDLRYLSYSGAGASYK